MVRYFWSESNGTNRPTVRYMDFEPSTEYYNGMPLKKNEAGAVMPTTGEPEYICMWDYQPDGDIRTLEIPVIEIFPDTIYEKWNEDGTVEEVRFGSGGGGLPSDLVETVPGEVPLEITFDGNLDNYETIENNGAYCVKVSDNALTMEQLIGGTLVLSLSGKETVIPLTSENVMDGMSAMGVPVIFVKMETVMIVYGDASAAGLPLSIGVWFTYMDQNEFPKSLSNPNVLIPGGERTQIKPEFMPPHKHKWNDIEDQPFYENVKTLYSAENVEFPYDMDFVIFLPKLLGIVPGETYDVIWDGKKYSCTAFSTEVEGLTVFGLGNKVQLGIDTGEPFMYMEIPDQGMSGMSDVASQMSMASESTYHSFSIMSVVIEKLDQKFYEQPCYENIEVLKEFPARSVEFVADELFGTPVNICTSPADVFADFFAEMVNYTEPPTLKVIFDGEEIVANGEIVNSNDFSYSFNGIFSMTFEPEKGDGGTALIAAGSPGIHKIELAIVESKITPLPEKFMPELNQLTMISPSGKKFKVTVSDSGSLTAVEV